MAMTLQPNSPDLSARLRSFFQEQPRVELAWLFGSAARGTTGPLSDVDVAVRFSGPGDDDFNDRLRLHDALCRYLGSDRVDLIDLAQASPVLRFNVICDGILLKGDHSVRVPFEVRAMSEYFDTHALREPHDAALRASAGAGRT
ncbi:type VII toxin-antitoxin system MntA family adenylyltransferase antitoxin [Thioalkalivibrio thiocyanodenitrificans]|uniref:type VII toxin-antitoxin system MntA family adenylyltransferase antitoxin n=1 Tax=Thioalkalivibrio thiocyanodenitrificans TaxID=243063 RepID=UPI00036957B1|nr:nucleotidyltransferase domain-containing protein [Thioalkalivibrio thiocyanodenitrificans]